MSEYQILIIVVPEETKDDVVDTLIELDEISGFNLAKIAGYSKENSQFNILEQVEGYRNLFRFEILHTCQQQPQLLKSLDHVCGSAGLRYWITPIIQQGHFGDDG